METPINRTNYIKSSLVSSASWMRPDSWNSVSVVAAVMAIIPFKGNDAPQVVSAAIGMDDQVNTESESWPPTLNSSNLGVFLYLCT